MENMNNEIIVGGKYQHYKGNYYVVVAKAVLENTMEEAVVYFPLEKKECYWIRTVENFLEPVEKANNQPRFKYIEMAKEEDKIF